MTEFGNADEDIYSTEGTDTRSEKCMQDDGSDSGNVVEKIVTFPQFRPRDDHEEQADFEAKEDRDDGDQSAHLMTILPFSLPCFP